MTGEEARRLEADVALTVMGWTSAERLDGEARGWPPEIKESEKRWPHGLSFTRYSESVSLAFSVVEKVCEGDRVKVIINYRKGYAYAAFNKAGVGFGGDISLGEYEDEEGNLAVAICRAALAMVAPEIPF